MRRPIAPWRLLQRRRRGLRTRMIVLLMAGLLFAGAGFEVLLVTLTSQREYEELAARVRSLARLVAERSVTPTLVNDRAELGQQVRLAIAEPDMQAAAIYPVRGPALAHRAFDAGLWAALVPPRGRAERGAVVVTRRRVRDGEVMDAVASIVRRSRSQGALGEADQLYGFTEPPRAAVAEHLGWVRLVVSTERARQAVRTAAQMGLLLLALTAVLGYFAVSIFVRVVIRPLREAGDLAREIASGELDRRLPVRGADELADLASSMNTMAGALQVARREAEDEAEALRTVSAAMLSIARGARAAHDPHSIFTMVAHGVKQVTRADAVALATPSADRSEPAFEHFDPPAPWAGLHPGLPVPPELAARLHGLEDGAVHLPADSIGVACPGLAQEGYRSLLVVPMQLPNSPPALLFVAARDPEAFPALERDVVVALTSHLSSALHAGRLEERLDAAFQELQRTHDYLVQSEMLRVAGEMAAGVAHDFNNVLGAILGRTQLLARRLAAGALSTEELGASLAVIERAAQDGRETGRRLRQFGHPMLRPATEAVDLHAMLQDAIEFTRPRWENEALAAGITIHVSFESRPGAWVAGRANELREIFTNLILNAVDALPRGGAIRVAGDDDGQRVTATVADDGVGMDEETARRLFEPFFTTKGAGGTGLGLSVVYGLVQRHGGTIEVTTRPGAGTRVEVSFPRIVAPAAAPAGTCAPDDLPALDVLVVDDEAPVREVLRDIALALGQRVTACASGDEALRALHPGAFQLVLTDLGMPGMTGWELARQVHAIDPAVPIVFVTGWGEDVDRRAAADVGASLVLAKPFNVEDVARALRLAAGAREERRAA